MLFRSVAFWAGLGDSVGQVCVNEYDEGSSSWIQRGSNCFEGYSVSLSEDGSVLAIGSPWSDGKGIVQIFEYSTTSLSWTQRGSNINGEADGENFGHAVSLANNGNWVPIGAPNYDASVCEGCGGEGRVQVFKWDSEGEVWKQKGEDIDGEFPQIGRAHV